MNEHRLTIEEWGKKTNYIYNNDIVTRDWTDVYGDYRTETANIFTIDALISMGHAYGVAGDYDSEEFKTAIETLNKEIEILNNKYPDVSFEHTPDDDGNYGWVSVDYTITHYPFTVDDCKPIEELSRAMYNAGLERCETESWSDCSCCGWNLYRGGGYWDILSCNEENANELGFDYDKDSWFGTLHRTIEFLHDSLYLPPVFAMIDGPGCELYKFI